VFQWHSLFKTGRISVDDNEHTGRPTSCTTPETVALIKELLHQDRRRTIHDIAEEVGIGYGICQRVLTKEVAMHRFAAKFVPRILTHCRPHPAVSGGTKMAANPSHYDFFLFSKMKLKLKGSQFDTSEKIQAIRTECFKCLTL
jgi:hypothetical protein